MCECVDSQEIKEELYPDWATDEDIRSAYSAMYERPKPEPVDE